MERLVSGIIAVLDAIFSRQVTVNITVAINLNAAPKD